MCVCVFFVSALLCDLLFCVVYFSAFCLRVMLVVLLFSFCCFVVVLLFCCVVCVFPFYRSAVLSLSVFVLLPFRCFDVSCSVFFVLVWHLYSCILFCLVCVFVLSICLLLFCCVLFSFSVVCVLV